MCDDIKCDDIVCVMITAVLQEKERVKYEYEEFNQDKLIWLHIWSMISIMMSEPDYLDW